MNSQIDEFKIFIQTTINDFALHYKIVEKLNCNVAVIETYDRAITLIKLIGNTEFKENLKVNYLQQIQQNIINIINQLPFRGQDNENFVDHQPVAWKENMKLQFEVNSTNIDNILSPLEFTFDFFKKIHFFSNSIVAIGANGSGKTSLSNMFKTYLQNNGLVISAQRILLVPDFNAISNPSITANELKQSQQRDKTNKNANEFAHLQQEFSLVLKNLLAENISAGNEYRKKSLELYAQGKPYEIPIQTKLDKTLSIWNSLIEHRTISCEDGMNITSKSDTGESYSAIQMSDGEKVMLYLIGQVLQAPINGFIVIDEPEMYLHKTILKKLWDILERERQDCLFIYLTHDLDFATSRIASKKIWIKSFIYPNQWEIEDIPENDIPEALLFELLGSRKNILFCEGEKGKIDERIYSIIFPSFTVIPVGGCFDVINYTKSFNCIPNITTTAYGIIDSDYHGADRLISLKEKNIYSFSVSEPENLFLNEDFLSYLTRQFMKDISLIQDIKRDVINELDKLKETQCSNYVSAKINHYFKDSHVAKANVLANVKSNYELFTSEIKIDIWHEERMNLIQELISQNDYNRIISIFNNKGLKHIPSKHLHINDFTDSAIRLLQFNPESHACLYTYFPSEIVEAGKNNTVL